MSSVMASRATPVCGKDGDDDRPRGSRKALPYVLCPVDDPQESRLRATTPAAALSLAPRPVAASASQLSSIAHEDC